MNTEISGIFWLSDFLDFWWRTYCSRNSNLDFQIFSAPVFALVFLLYMCINPFLLTDYLLINLRGQMRNRAQRGEVPTCLSSGKDSPGLCSLVMKFAQARPKTTRSNKELAPRRLAPCTDAQAASPAAHRPSIISSLPSLVVVRTWKIIDVVFLLCEHEHFFWLMVVY